MLITRAAFAASALQLRATEALITSQIHALRDNKQWTGPDADRFFDEWDVDVKARLLRAAGRLESLGFESFP